MSKERQPGTESSDHGHESSGPHYSRRQFMTDVAARTAAVLATAGLAYEIGGSQILNELLGDDQKEEADFIPEHEALEELEKVEAHAEKVAHDAIQKVEEHFPELSDREKAMKAIDYLGCGVFAYGVASLLSESHITALHYGMFAAVMNAKYFASTPEERHHLMEEFHSSAKAGMIIGGTVVLAEGIKADLDKAYKKIAGRELSNTDRVAMLTMLSGTMSPLVTTVGAATLCKKMAAELAGGDEDRAAVLMQYVSNSSGFLLFGDPPFIAVNEEYGFKEGIAWQARTMWPMGLYSLMSSAFKLNLLRAKEEAGEENNHVTWALRETVRGMRTNLPVMGSLIKASLKNVSKFYSGADLMGDSPQTEDGLMFDVDKVLEEKFQGVLALFKGQIDSSTHHEDVEGLVGDSREEKANKMFLREAFKLIFESGDYEAEDVVKIESAIRDSDFEKIENLSRAMGIDPSQITPLLYAAKSIHLSHRPQDPEEKERPWQERAFHYTQHLTNLNNVKGAIGHNLGDIVNVFPFQAGSVPFLTTAFMDIRSAVSQFLGSEGNETLTEAVMFFLIMAFSSIADNYVACKIGLKLYPGKPELALVPAVIGGGMSSVGNMANLALFNLKQMPLLTSFAKDYWHLDIAAFGLVWTQVLRHLQANPAFGLIFGQTPPLKKAA